MSEYGPSRIPRKNSFDKNCKVSASRSFGFPSMSSSNPVRRRRKVRTEGNVTILPVVEEVLVVERRLLIKEELRLIRHATKEVIETPVTLRKQRAVVERLDSEGELITDAMEKQT